MTNSNLLLDNFSNQKMDTVLKKIYDENMISYQSDRYAKAIQNYMELFGENDIEIYSAPGRTEVSGNHTDHQNGMVLAASISLDAIAIVSKCSDNIIELKSEGYDLIKIDMNSLDCSESEFGTTTALIKGVIKKMQENGHNTGAFKAYVTSDVLGGSGLSSSAAFETLIGTIISGLYNDMAVSPIEIAQIGQYAENVFFGKPCGLMDQMACSVGDFVFIDFKDLGNPVVKKIPFDISAKGYSLCIVDTKGSHADLTDEYAAIPSEMKEVAHFFGKERLSEISKEEFINAMPRLYGQVNDRAILRAFHFYNEQQRVADATKKLDADDMDGFLNIIKESGASSFRWLQNIYANKAATTQPVSMTLAFTEDFLKDNGVCRVHGGGFAGTIQAFVKTDIVPEYKKFIEGILGEGTCHVLTIRKYGGVKVTE